MVMSILSEKRCKLRSANHRNEKPSRQEAERANFPEENTHGLRSLSQKSRKGQIPKKIAHKSKKLELNCTNLKLKRKKTRSDCAKVPDPSVSSGLKVKNKTNTRFAWAGGTCPRFAWAGGTFFPVVLLCQFLVMAGNRFWFYILLMYLGYRTLQLWFCVSFFGSSGK
jgi:hypothetical protein